MSAGSARADPHERRRGLSPLPAPPRGAPTGLSGPPETPGPGRGHGQRGGGRLGARPAPPEPPPKRADPGRADPRPRHRWRPRPRPRHSLRGRAGGAPMRFEVDVAELAVVLELETEPPGVDLARDGLGDGCLDAAVEGMLGSHRAQAAPDGTPWAPLAAATIRRKGHAVIGVQSGILLDPQRWRTAPRDIEPRVATWYYPSTGRTGDGCDGHAPRLPCRPSAHREPGAADPGLDAGGTGDLPPAVVRGGPRRGARPPLRADPVALSTPPGPARSGRRPRPARRRRPLLPTRPRPLHPTRMRRPPGRCPRSSGLGIVTRPLHPPHARPRLIRRSRSHPESGCSVYETDRRYNGNRREKRTRAVNLMNASWFFPLIASLRHQRQFA